MHGGRSGIGWDTDGGQFGVIRLERAGALTINANASRDKIRFQREGVTIALFYPGDLTGTFEPRQGLRKLALLVGRHGEARAYL